MALNELLQKQVEKSLDKFCDERIPERVKDQIKLDYKIRGKSVTLVEKRPHYQDSEEWVAIKIAQFRFNPDNNNWSLYWWRHTGSWYKYDNIKPTKDFQKLIEEIDEDPTHIFWG
ncbi:MAG: DUF3024 domain-containing protein [Bacillota bacterium]